MRRVEYLVMMDLDELIIPYQSTSLTGMLAELRQRSLVQAGRRVSPQQVSSYSFQNGFFYLQWPDSDSPSVPPLPALTKTRRRHKLHPPKQRSKYICLPTEVKEVSLSHDLVRRDGCGVCVQFFICGGSVGRVGSVESVRSVIG